MKLRVLLVDREYTARQELRNALSEFGEVEILGEAADAREALHLIEALSYDAVFLEVDLPGVSGLELAETLRERAPEVKVVFVTSHDSHAVEAFRVHAADYLLKPVHHSRLAETIDRLFESKGRTSLPSNVGNLETLQWVAAERHGAKVPIHIEQIIYVSTEGYNVFIHTEQERLLTRFTLQELTNRLPVDIFFRCHRSYVVNMNHVKEIIPHLNGTYLLKMKDEARAEIPVSRSRVRELRSLFSLS